MQYVRPRSNASRWAVGALAAGVAVVLVLIASAAVDQEPSPIASSTGTSDTRLNAREDNSPDMQPQSPSATEVPVDDGYVSEEEALSSPDFELTADDGYISDGETLSPFDTDIPAIANLDAGLRAAIQNAATDAGADGVAMFINSGWRSERYQQTLLDEAIVRYGSEGEARKWVNSPERSTHVTGEAVDVGPTDADSWLSQHGNEYGLCQTYANEAWHYELTVEPGGICPEQISDASAY